MSNNRKGITLYLLASFMIIMWGSSLISTKYLLLAGLNPSEIYIIRFIIAYVCLLAFSWRTFGVRSWRDEFIFFLCGLFGGSVYFIGENIALTLTNTNNVGLLVSTAPLLTALIARIFFPEEKITRGVVIGSVIAFIGVGFVMFNSSHAVEINPLGDILALAAAAAWAIYSLLLRRVNDNYDIMTLTRKVFFYGIITSLPLTFTFDNHLTAEIFSDPWVWFNLLLLSIVMSMCCYLIWNKMVEEWGPIVSSNWIYLQPIVTLIACAIFLNESISLIGGIGIALVFIGVVFAGIYDQIRDRHKASGTPSAG